MKKITILSFQEKFAIENALSNIQNNSLTFQF